MHQTANKEKITKINAQSQLAKNDWHSFNERCENGDFSVASEINCGVKDW
jgi:hypothetical protein